jgi:hypothetical protein
MPSTDIPWSLRTHIMAALASFTFVLTRRSHLTRAPMSQVTGDQPRQRACGRPARQPRIGWHQQPLYASRHSGRHGSW